MKHQRTFLLLNFVLIMAMLLAACSPKTPEVVPATDVPPTEAVAAPQPTQAEAPAETPAGEVPVVLNMPDQIAGGRPVEISVVGRPPDSQASLLQAWQEQAARFTAKYPNVTITGSDYAYTPDSFAALVAGNQVPTLFQVYMTDPSKMIEQGIAADLTSFYKAQNLMGVYNPQVMSLVSKDNKIYGIPIKAYAMGLAYNIQMLKDAGYDAPPTTWDELAVMAQKLTDRDNGIAGLSLITDGSAATGWHATTFAYNFGLKNTDIVTLNSDGSYKAGFGEGAMVSALNFLKDLRWKYDVLPRENLAWPTNGEALATGRAAMVIMAGDQFTWIRQTYTDVDMNQFGFAPLPAGANGESVSLIGGDVAMVNADATPDQIEAAAYYRLWERLDAAEIKTRFEQGKADPTQVVGAPQLPMFTGDYQTSTAALEKQYANLPVDNYKLFMDAIVSGKTRIMPEPLIAGQEYYAALGTVVSQIVADENVDVAAVLKEAAKTFQTNVLDMLKPSSGEPVGSEPVDTGVPVVLNMPDQIAGGRPVEISVVGRPPDSQASLLQAWQEQAARFTAKYPNVTITGSDYAYTPDSFAALVAGNQVPTLFQVYMTDPSKMIEQGIAADLTSFYEDQNLFGVYNPQVMSLVSQDNKVYGIPIKAYAMGLAYNIQMLKDAGYDTPPTTWDELAVMAQKLTDRDNGIAGLSLITDGSGAAGWHATTFAYNFGLKNTDIVSVQDGKLTAGFGNDAMLAALGFLKDLRWKYDVLPRENLAWPTNGEALATGRAAMVIMAGDQFTWIRQTYTDVDMNQFGFAPLPAGANGQSVSLIGGDVAMVNADATADQIEAAAYYRLWERLDAAEIALRFEQGKADPTQVVGAPQLPMFTGDYQTATAALEKQYANLPVDNYKLFMDAIVSGATKIMPEPLIAGQEYYAALGTVVSQIVADETVDVAAVLADAVATFQANVLDLLK